MTFTRRTFVNQLCTALAGVSAMQISDASAPRKLGLIYPPVRSDAPPEGLAMYGDRIEFIGTGLGLKTMTADGYNAVVAKVGPAAELLAQQGAEAIVLMGTSLSFYQGQAYNQTLTDTMRAASGLPAVTMSTAVIEALQTVGGDRVAVATAYNNDVNDRLRRFLGEHGITAINVTGLGIEKVEDIEQVTQPALLDFSVKVCKASRGADATLVSCGGLRTLEILAPLEQRTGVPAVSSTPHALWAGARLLGDSGRAVGFGSLLTEL